MGDVVNLRQARKRAARRTREAEAETNRATFGMPADLKARARREKADAQSFLDGHRLDRTAPDGGDAG